MTIVVYGDFGCPYSYLASLRADQLLRRSAVEIDWRAIGPDHRVPTASLWPDGGRDDLGRDLATVSALARPGEQPPRPPAGPVDVRPAVAAYAESVSDGMQHQMRRRLFAATWAEARRVSDVYEVQKLIAEVMCPPEPISPHLISPDLPCALLHEPDVNLVVRREGGTVTVYGGPLTTAGERRLGQWRHEWLALACPELPVVIGPDGTVLPRSGALGYLATAADGGALAAPRLPAASAGS